jgi:hypothetical protein
MLIEIIKKHIRMNWLFYHLYNFYYKDGNNKKNITPWFQAISVMALGALFWSMLFYHLINDFILKSELELGKVSLLVTMFCFFIIFYYLFVRNDNYETIYNHYKDLSNREKVIGKIIAISFVILPFLLDALELGLSGKKPSLL